jgi:hypothetical protein
MATSDITNLTNVRELTDLSPGGTRLGKTAAELIGFHGATPTAQSTAVTLATGATFAVIVTAVQGILSRLRTKGLIAT